MVRRRPAATSGDVRVGISSLQSPASRPARTRRANIPTTRTQSPRTSPAADARPNSQGWRRAAPSDVDVRAAGWWAPRNRRGRESRPAASNGAASSWSTEGTHPGWAFDAYGAPQPPPVAGLVARPLNREARNSQGSVGGGAAGGHGSAGTLTQGLYFAHGDVGHPTVDEGSTEFLPGRSARGGAGGSDDELRAAAGSLAPGTAARKELLVRYHEKKAAQVQEADSVRIEEGARG